MAALNKGQSRIKIRLIVIGYVHHAKEHSETVTGHCLLTSVEMRELSILILKWYQWESDIISEHYYVKNIIISLM